MICQRSGTCCTTMDVIIRVGDRYKMKPGGVQCPHLQWEGNQASCAVHEEPWYKDMPCFVYGNPDIDPDFAPKRGRPCLVGEMQQRSGELVALRHRRAPVEELEDLGSVEKEHG